MVKSTKLFYRDGNSDKVYHASIEESNGLYVVNFAYGRRGSTLTIGTKTTSPVDLVSAEKIYNKLITEKTAKGYVADGHAAPFSGVDTANRVTGMVPQLLNPISEQELEEFINDPNWMMQEKLDGKRIMVEVRDGVVTASNRRGLSVALPEETEQALAQFSNITLDGELIGSVYYVFDYLEKDGIDLRMDSAKVRLLVADLLKVNSKYIVFVSTAFTREEKIEMLSKFKTSEKEGVVIKNIHAPYTPGKPNSGGNQLKCKFYSTCTAVVINVNNKRSIEVGVKNDDGKIISVGNVTIPPNKDIPEKDSLVEIRYLYAYRNGSLCQPVYLNERDDVEVDSTSLLKYKSENDD